MGKRLSGRKTAKNILKVEKYNRSEIVDYNTRKGVLKDLFTGISKLIVEQGFDYKIPYGLGRIYIKRWRPKRENRAVDWFNTKKYGKVIYHANNHSNGYAAKWHWDKFRTRAKGIGLYKFSPTRHNKRYLNRVIKELNTISEYRAW